MVDIEIAAKEFRLEVLRWEQTIVHKNADLINKAYLIGPAHGGKADPVPWSGWWWPFLDGPSPNLYDVGGPLEKYDQYVKNVTGTDPKTKEREETTFQLGYKHYTTDPTQGWFGHCNGWAAAAVSDPEPTGQKTKSGVVFDVGDLKGILSEAHWYDGSDLRLKIGAEDAHLFHRALIDWVGKGKTAIIMDARLGPQVWNYPVGAYYMAYEADPAVADRLRVSCTVFFVGDDVSPDFVGVDGYPTHYGKKYTYWIEGSVESPSKGGWENASTTDHPDVVWHPQYIESGYHGVFGTGKPNHVINILS